MRPRDVVTKGCATWGVGKRMAQIYVAAARKQLHSDALQQSHLFAQELAQHQRLKVFHESRAVVNDPQTSDARRRAQISFFGKVTRLFADYEKSAKQADEMHATEKFMPRPLQPMDLQVEFDRLQGESDVVDKWVDKAERATGAAEPGTNHVPVASSAGSTTAATASASTQETRATAQPDRTTSPQPHDHEHLAEHQGDCAHFADCAAKADDPAPEAPEFNPTTCQKIVASVQRGARLPVAAAAAGISRQTLRHWLKSDGAAFKDFRQQVRQGKGQARLQAERTVYQKDACYWLSRGPGGWRDVDKSPDQSNENESTREEFNEMQAFVLEYLHGLPAAKADLARKLLEWDAKRERKS